VEVNSFIGGKKKESFKEREKNVGGEIRYVRRKGKGSRKKTTIVRNTVGNIKKEPGQKVGGEKKKSKNENVEETPERLEQSVTTSNVSEKRTRNGG